MVICASVFLNIRANIELPKLVEQAESIIELLENQYLNQ